MKRSGGPAAPQFPKIREGEICITWIGHASFLIQTHEVNILIDPIWSKWLKVIKRLKQPGFEIHHLPSIDFVLVTHAHFDHLDRRTLRRVAADQPIVVPMGVGNLVHDLGFRIVHELDYWQTVELGPPTGREVHMNPEEAVKAFLELRADTLIPMHYGTFRLGFEPLHEPPQRLLTAARAHGIDEKILVMTEGKPVVL